MKFNLIICIIIFIFLFNISAVAQNESNSSVDLKNSQIVELLKKAQALEEIGKFESAIETYKDVLKIEPGSFKVMTIISALYGQLELADKQIEWAKKAIVVNPEYFGAYINYGNGLGRMKKFDEASKAFLKASELSQDNPLPFYSLGLVAEKQNKLAEAVKFYNKSIKIEPNFDFGLYSLASVKAKLKHFDEAINLLNRLLKIKPNSEQAIQLLKSIKLEKAKLKKNRISS